MKDGEQEITLNFRQMVCSAEDSSDELSSLPPFIFVESSVLSVSSPLSEVGGRGMVKENRNCDTLSSSKDGEELCWRVGGEVDERYSLS